MERLWKSTTIINLCHCKKYGNDVLRGVFHLSIVWNAVEHVVHVGPCLYMVLRIVPKDRKHCGKQYDLSHDAIKLQGCIKDRMASVLGHNCL